MKAVNISLGARDLVDRPIPEPEADEVLIKSASFFVAGRTARSEWAP
jgi:hypothetical protein